MITRRRRTACIQKGFKEEGEEGGEEKNFSPSSEISANDDMEQTSAAVIEMAADSKAGEKKKRHLVLSAYVACLMFLIFFVTTLDALIRELLENERVWQNLEMLRQLFDNRTGTMEKE